MSTYKAVTKDNKEYLRENVKVEKSDNTVSKEYHTIKAINTGIATLTARIAELQNEKTLLDALIGPVTTAANKVKLKSEPEE